MFLWNSQKSPILNIPQNTWFLFTYFSLPKTENQKSHSVVFIFFISVYIPQSCILCLKYLPDLFHPLWPLPFLHALTFLRRILKSFLYGFLPLISYFSPIHLPNLSPKLSSPIESWSSPYDGFLLYPGIVGNTTSHSNHYRCDIIRCNLASVSHHLSNTYFSGRLCILFMKENAGRSMNSLFFLRWNTVLWLQDTASALNIGNDLHLR